MAARIVNHLKRADLGDLRLLPVPPPHMLGMLLVGRLLPVPPPHMLGMLLVGHGDDVCIVANRLFILCVSSIPANENDECDRCC